MGEWLQTLANLPRTHRRAVVTQLLQEIAPQHPPLRRWIVGAASVAARQKPVSGDHVYLALLDDLATRLPDASILTWVRHLCRLVTEADPACPPHALPPNLEALLETIMGRVLDHRRAPRTSKPVNITPPPLPLNPLGRWLAEVHNRPQEVQPSPDLPMVDLDEDQQPDSGSVVDLGCAAIGWWLAAQDSMPHLDLEKLAGDSDVVLMLIARRLGFEIPFDLRRFIDGTLVLMKSAPWAARTLNTMLSTIRDGQTEAGWLNLTQRLLDDTQQLQDMQSQDAGLMSELAWVESLDVVQRRHVVAVAAALALKTTADQPSIEVLQQLDPANLPDLSAIETELVRLGADLGQEATSFRLLARLRVLRLCQSLGEAFDLNLWDSPQRRQLNELACALATVVDPQADGQRPARLQPLVQAWRQVILDATPPPANKAPH